MPRNSLSCLRFALTLTASLLLLLAPASAISGKIIAQLSATDNGPNSFFGAAVAISADGKTIAVAAPGADVNNGIGEEVYIYEKPTGGWTNMTQVARLYSPNCPVTGAAGASIAITPDGSTIVYQCIDLLGALAVGPINVFIRPASGWQDGRPPDANFYSPNGGGSAASSLAVGYKGDAITTTGSTYNPDTNISSWFLYLFDKPPGGWTNNMTPTQIESLGTVAAAYDEAQAGPVAMNNDWVAATNPYSGTLYLFRRTPTGLQGAGSITASGVGLAYFSLAINDSGIFAGGGYYTDDDSMFFPDVFVFAYSPLTQVAQLVPPTTPSASGSPAVVALSGKHLLAESYEEAPALFVEPTGGWQTTSQPDLILNVPNGNESYQPLPSANTLAIAVNVVVSGNEWADPTNSGAAYVYRLKE